MATIKHISSKNADYGAAEKYLLYEHDGFTMKPILENGCLVPREDYRIGAVLTTPDRFAADCMAANLRYGKNMARGDIKSHHYIISFDPRDGPDHGLTIDRVQELGMKFCKEHFPGHQALVCTHPDGHNHSGNIHVHIVINSLRIEDVPFKPYMDRACDTKAGMKHRCTGKALRYLRGEVMEMCQEEGLYQIDLLNGSDERVSDREYWAQKKGQMGLDKANSKNNISGREPAAETGKTKPTKFETEKEKLRKQIRAVLEEAPDFETFRAKLQQDYGVTVKESRGRFSYLTPDRTKSITARKLGDVFEKAAVLAKLEENRERKENARDIFASGAKQPGNKYPDGNTAGNAARGKTGQAEARRTSQTKLQDDPIGHVVDVAEKMAVSPGYGKWAKMHNLKTEAKSFVYLQSHGFSNLEELDAAYAAAKGEASDALAEYRDEKQRYQGKKERLAYATDYWTTKKQRDGYKRSINKKAYRRSYPEELARSEAAEKYFSGRGIAKPPSRKAAQEELDISAVRKNDLYQMYEAKKQRRDELKKVRDNLEELLHPKAQAPYPGFPEPAKDMPDRTGKPGRDMTEKAEATPPLERRSVLDRLHEKRVLVDEREAAKKRNRTQKRGHGDMEL